MSALDFSGGLDGAPELPALSCAGGAGGITTVPAFVVCTEEPFGVITVTVFDNAGGGDGGAAALELACAGGPDERNDINLFSKSNQNGAPREIANVVASNPTIFKNQP